jgi:hypothetical protein
MTAKQELEQLRFRLEHKQWCFQRAMDRFDIHDANIFAAQAEYIFGLITRAEQKATPC